MNTNKKTVSILFAFIFCFLFLTVFPAGAQIVEVKRTGAQGQTAEFWVRGRLIGRLPAGDNEEVYESRISNWSRRLEEIFTRTVDPRNIKAGNVGGTGIVFNGSAQLFSFDGATAALLDATPLQIAQSWAANIRFALVNAPGFEPAVNSVTVPLNEEISISFKGSFPGEMDFYNFDTNIISLRGDKGVSKIFIKGHNLGRGTFSVKAADIERTIYFKVQERAAAIPEYMKLEVSGNPAPASMIQHAFESSVQYRSNPKGNSYTVIGKPGDKKNFASIYPGRSDSFVIPVKIDGPDYIPAIKNVKLTVENVNYNWPEPKVLLVSNKPEVIKEDRDLMDGMIKGSEPARYFYHHKNAHTQAWRNFYISLHNPTSEPVTAFVCPVGAGPTPDEIFAGHLALSAYYDAKAIRRGWFITIRPGSSYILEKRLAKTDQTISGIGYVSLTSAGMLKFTCYASTIPGAIPPEGTVPYVEKPDIRTSKGIFPAFIDLAYSHEIGGRYTFINLGGEPYQEDLIDGHPNYGNYGAYYRINLEIKNPREGSRDAWVYFVPGGGVARGILEVDGRVLETGVVQPAQKVLLKKVTIPQGGAQNVNIKTMPQGGSYYPVKIVVESEFVRDGSGLINTQTTPEKEKDGTIEAVEPVEVRDEVKPEPGGSGTGEKAEKEAVSPEHDEEPNGAGPENNLPFK